jgi:hypothetical protein
MKTFEYRIESLSPSSREDMMEKLNDLGSEGWQLVMVVNRVAYFMRELSNQPHGGFGRQGVANG